MKTTEAFKTVLNVWEPEGVIYTGRDGRVLFAYKELESYRYHLSFSFTERFNGLGVTFGCSFIPNTLGQAINFIDEEEHTVFPFKERNWTFNQVSLKELVPLSKMVLAEAEKWIEIADFSDYMNWLVSTLKYPGSHQLWHISALSVNGEILLLDKYKRNLDDEDRGGLYPYITSNIIDRAIEYANKNT
jgi:ABC-type branched-subunit amino acid transport system ATPase component